MRLEVHHINVSQGDATLIINRDIDALWQKVNETFPSHRKLDDSTLLHYAIEKGMDLEGTVKYALLVDAADISLGYSVFKYIRTYGVKGAETQKNFYVIGTHHHSDHIGGFRDIYCKPGPHYDNDKDDIVVNYPPSVAYGFLKRTDLDPDTEVYNYYLGDLQEQVKYRVRVVKPQPGLVIRLGTGVNDGREDVPIYLTCVAVNRKVEWLEPFKPTIPADENARSVVLILVYGPFRYFLGGDIGGTGKAEGGNFGDCEYVRTPRPGGGHENFETPVRKALQFKYLPSSHGLMGHVCAFKANHHGSGSSNDIHLLAATRPKVFIISSGTYPRFHRHPTQPVINRIDSGFSPTWKKANGDKIANTIANYYITEMATNKRSSDPKKHFEREFSNSSKGRILGDIIVRPDDRDIIEKGRGGVRINVYGSGRQAANFPDGKKLRRAVRSDPFANPLDDSKGPWTHKCDLHQD